MAKVDARGVPTQVQEMLIDQLIYLFGDKGSKTMLSLAQAAGLRPEIIAENAIPAVTLRNIVNEAGKQRRLAELVREARSWYPEDAKLREVARLLLDDADVRGRVEDVGERIAAQISLLRQEMHAMEEKLNGRMDGLADDISQLKATAMTYTSKRRTAWLGGFIIILFTLLITIPGIYDSLEMNTASVVIIVLLGWVMGGGLLMYGLGFLRGL